MFNFQNKDKHLKQKNIENTFIFNTHKDKQMRVYRLRKCLSLTPIFPMEIFGGSFLEMFNFKGIF